ncbi:MAG: phosphoenolpyruvate--protein phosphotransferase [Verrucomicrobia bacterium]|nr:phosphoenolpyruvate--protein phosphotransferase [Verrucomicrobiota bacterium]
MSAVAQTGSQTGLKVMRGVAASEGVCHGKVLVLRAGTEEAIPSYTIQEAEVPHHVQRLEQAMMLTRHQILEVQQKVSQSIGSHDAAIFDAHLLVLQDPALVDEVTRLIQDEKANVEYAFHQAARNYAAALGALADDPFLRERAADMRDVTQRIMRNLTGQQDGTDLAHLQERCIIVSHDLAPSQTAVLDKNMVLGFATDIGSKTAHTAIMARSLGIPAVVGLGDASQTLQTGQHVLLDGFNGLLIVNPTEQALFEYGQLVTRKAGLEEKLRETLDKAAITLDGSSIVLSSNIELPAEVEQVKASGADGVGLYRTEYFFINRTDLPTEEEQYQAYRQVAAALKPHPVIIRTLDLGGDKFFSHVKVAPEMNPFLGWRAIRFCLEEKDLFRTQLRAILRASAEGNVKMMYPMVSGLDELNRANELVEECRGQLRKDGFPFDENMDIGIMIEIPSAALAADALAKRVKFFSLGTNDLVQYTLAVDRLNARIAHLYEPTHPAILRLIKMTTEAAHAHGIWTGVCGEMANDANLTPLLLGLGADEISVAPTFVPKIKHLIRRLKMTEARDLADFALNCESAQEILRRSKALAMAVAPTLFDKAVESQS